MLNLIFKVKFIMNLMNFVAIEIKLDAEKNQIHLVNLKRFLKRPTYLDGTCDVPQCSKFF